MSDNTASSKTPRACDVAWLSLNQRKQDRGKGWGMCWPTGMARKGKGGCGERSETPRVCHLSFSERHPAGT